MAGLLTGIGLTEIYRLDEDEAFRQGLWIVIGLVAFAGTLLALRRDYRRLESYKYLFGLGALVLLVLPAMPFIGENRERRAALGRARAGAVPARGVREDLPDRLPRRLPAREARGAGAGAAQGPRPAALHLGRRDGRARPHERPRRRASLLRDLPGDALRRHCADLVRGRGGCDVRRRRRARLHPGRAGRRARRGCGSIPWSDADGGGYQTIQSIYAIANGHFGGTGFGQGTFTDADGNQLIPYVSTDFIYSALAQELGLVGISAFLLVYMLFAARGFRIAMLAQDGFSKLLAVGLTFCFTLQTFIIVGGIVRIIPLTGITLPFVSYGGSSIVANFVLLAGLLLVSNRANERLGT